MHNGRPRSETMNKDSMRNYSSNSLVNFTGLRREEGGEGWGICPLDYDAESEASEGSCTHWSHWRSWMKMGEFRLLKASSAPLRAPPRGSRMNSFPLGLAPITAGTARFVLIILFHRRMPWNSFQIFRLLMGVLLGIWNALQTEGPCALLHQRTSLEWFEFSELHEWVFSHVAKANILSVGNYSLFIHQLPAHSQTRLLGRYVPLSTYLKTLGVGGGGGAISLSPIHHQARNPKELGYKGLESTFLFGCQGESHVYRVSRAQWLSVQTHRILQDRV